MQDRAEMDERCESVSVVRESPEAIVQFDAEMHIRCQHMLVLF